MSQMYRLQVNSYGLVSGYVDIEGHWAQDAISQLTEQGMISGYGNYRFAPNQSITRAEAATVLSRCLEANETQGAAFQ